MNDSIYLPPLPENEKVLSYAPGSPERARLDAEIASILSARVEVPVVFGGKRLLTGRTRPIIRPDERRTVLGQWHAAGQAETRAAIEAAMEAKPGWEAMPWEERAAVFRRAAELVSGKYRSRIVAATMLGQSKTVHQAEIDAACEVADFFRFGAATMARVYAEQPRDAPGEWNRASYRPLEGFVCALSPFNFTALAANLAAAPALMGNVVVWKPASSSILSSWVLMQIYEEAGLPPGVINFLPGNGAEISELIIADPRFSGLHFTGSTAVFRSLWMRIAGNLDSYTSYPRLVGETGGKDFVFVHPSADLDAARVGIIRGAYEYQGQKCSAASRLYVPRSIAPAFLDGLAAEVKSLPMGKVTDYANFLGAVIDEAAFDGIMGHVGRARTEGRFLAGGRGDKASGFFVEPSLLLTEDPRSASMTTEIFGPLLSAYVYDDGDMDAALRLVDATSPYALTGSVFARDRGAIVRALSAFRHSAGNLYVNDKPTGAVVGRQPFGGARASGTNDKAGTAANLLRWASPCIVKENFDPPLEWRYPSMGSA
jgi:1-pyrroline-5-carboxylate dehydrogenase